MPLGCGVTRCQLAPKVVNASVLQPGSAGLAATMSECYWHDVLKGCGLMTLEVWPSKQPAGTSAWQKRLRCCAHRRPASSALGLAKRSGNAWLPSPTIATIRRLHSIAYPAVVMAGIKAFQQSLTMLSSTVPEASILYQTQSLCSDGFRYTTARHSLVQLRPSMTSSVASLVVKPLVPR